jgi:hypothetical protein
MRFGIVGRHDGGRQPTQPRSGKNLSDLRLRSRKPMPRAGMDDSPAVLGLRLGRGARLHDPVGRDRRSLPGSGLNGGESVPTWNGCHTSRELGLSRREDAPNGVVFRLTKSCPPGDVLKATPMGAAWSFAE